MMAATTASNRRSDGWIKRPDRVEREKQDGEGVGWRRARVRESDENERRGPFSQAVIAATTLAANRLDGPRMQDDQAVLQFGAYGKLQIAKNVSTVKLSLVKVGLVERYGCC